MPEENIIEVRNVSFKYGSNIILDKITFDIKEGEYLGIIGPNGAGKTTLLQILLGLLKPTTGTVKMFGQNINKLKDRALIGYVPQKSTQVANEFPATVEEIVKSGRTAKVGLFKQYNKADKEKIEWAMEITDIIDLRKKLINDLSGGQRQRVFIARALAAEPRILFLDEPTIAIDIASSQKFYEFLNKLNKELNITILFVSHDLDVIAKEVNTVLCLKQELICHGTPKDFLKKENLEKLYGDKFKLIVHE